MSARYLIGIDLGTTNSAVAFVGVYDAKRIPDGPVAKIWIDHHVPITFHGTFVGE